jgi:hypothetical protein
MPKEKPPRFPVGLTLDQAVARGWKPGQGRPLIAGDDEVIREVTPNDSGWIDPASQPSRCTSSFDRPKRRRRRSSSSGNDSPMARVRAAMERWQAAERERRRKWRKRRTTEKVLALPSPTNEALTSSAPLNAEIEIMSPNQTIVVPLEITPGVIAALRKRGFIPLGEISADHVAAAIFGALAQPFESRDFRAKPEPPPQAGEAPPPPAKALPSAEASPPAAETEELIDDVSGPPPATPTNGAEFDHEAEARRQYFERMARATS